MEKHGPIIGRNSGRNSYDGGKRQDSRYNKYEKMCSC